MRKSSISMETDRDTEQGYYLGIHQRYCFIRLTIALATSGLPKSSFIASSLRFLSGLSSMILRLLFIKNSRWSDFLTMLAFLMPKRLPTRLSGFEGSSDDSLITAP